jgi:integrase
MRNPSGACATLGEARDAYMRSLAKRSGSYRRTVAYRLEALVTALDKKTPLPSIGKEEVGGVLADWAKNHSPFSDASWNAWLGTFGGFFKWTVKAYKLASNPAEGLEKREVEEVEVDFLHAEDVEKLLRAAERVAPEYTAAVAVLFFAGLRPAELVGQYEGLGEGVRGGLDWDCVDIDGDIFLAGRDTKNRRKRQVPISANLRAWLDAYGGDKRGRLVPNPQAWKRARKAIVEEAGVDWPQDYARHTYASMHYAFHKDRAKLEASMGHDPASRVLEANYKRPVRKSEAERFWAIMPEGGAK